MRYTLIGWAAATAFVAGSAHAQSAGNVSLYGTLNVDAEYVREIRAGEMLVIDKNGLHSSFPFAEKPVSFCAFEHVYFSRPDSTIFGRSVNQSRHLMGRQLAVEHPVDNSDNADEFAWQHDDVFGRIASRYDLLCDVFSLGIHRLWKRRVSSQSRGTSSIR